MKEIKESKDIYDGIKIPSELSSLIEKAIETNKIKQPERSISMNKKIIKAILAAAAVFIVGITIGLNTNQAFAMSMEQLPIIGNIAKVLTIRDYESKDNVNVSIEQPEIQVEPEHTVSSDTTGIEDTAGPEEKTDASSTKEYVADVNATIEKIVADYKADATKRIEEYKEAFFATGGTEEEWMERGIDVNVSYEIKYQSDTTLSLVLDAYESWASFSEQRYYFNMDLVNGTDITLKDLLGDNYVEIANRTILEQIKERSETEGYIYWGYEQYNQEYSEANPDDSFAEEGFQTVSEDTNFYINEAGNPVIVFDKYEIGPGYIGFQEFEIEK